MLRSLFSDSRKRLDAWSDERLVEAFRDSGKSVYYDVLFDRYHTMVYARCLNLIVDPEESKDLTLLVFQKVYDVLPETDVQQWINWLMRLTSNTCLDFLRLHQRRNHLFRTWWEENEKKSPNFMENEGFRRLIYETSQEKLLDEGIEQLPPAQQDCLKRFINDLATYREIAAATGFTLQEVKSHLQNGRRRLKQWVQQQQAEL